MNRAYALGSVPPSVVDGDVLKYGGLAMAISKRSAVAEKSEPSVASRKSLSRRSTASLPDAFRVALVRAASSLSMTDLSTSNEVSEMEDVAPARRDCAAAIPRIPVPAPGSRIRKFPVIVRGMRLAMNSATSIGVKY